MEAGWEEEGVSLTGLDIETIRRLPGRGGDYIGRPTIESDFEPGGHWYRSRIENHGHLSRLLETTVIDPAIAYERIEGTLQSKKLLPYEGYHGPMAEKYGPNIHNASLLIDGDPYGFLNKLLLSRYQKILHNMKPEVFNLLQPYIRLYKVVWEDDGTEVDVEIKIPERKNHFTKTVEKVDGLPDVTLKDIIVLPCLAQGALGAGNPTHKARFHLASYLAARLRWFYPPESVSNEVKTEHVEQITQIISEQGWVDFDADVTQHQVETIIFGGDNKKGYCAATCATLEYDGLCVGRCRYYDGSIGDVDE